MVVYKIDRASHSQANTQIRDMANVLAEISPTLQTLQQVLDQQSSAFSTPSFNHYRDELQQKITEASRLAEEISEQSQKLANVSSEAVKHLMAIEEHFGAVLQRKTSQVS